MNLNLNFKACCLASNHSNLCQYGFYGAWPYIHIWLLTSFGSLGLYMRDSTRAKVHYLPHIQKINVLLRARGARCFFYIHKKNRQNNIYTSRYIRHIMPGGNLMTYPAARRTHTPNTHSALSRSPPVTAHTMHGTVTTRTYTRTRYHH